MRIDLLTLVLALLFVIGLLAIDSVRATRFGFSVELTQNAGSEKS